MSSGALQKPAQDKDFGNRLIFLIAIFFVSMVILLVSVSNIQLFRGLEFANKNKTNRERIVRLAPIRGKIKARDGKTVLADNKKIFSVYINQRNLPSDYLQRQESLVYLAEVIDMSYSDIESLLAKNVKRREDILIQDNITFNQYIRISENAERMPGIILKERNVRDYPFGTTLSHVLGYVGPISSEEYNLKKQNNYERNDIIGKIGLENYYEQELRGKEGHKIYVVDARNVIQTELKNREIIPEAGNEVILTVDLDLQKMVEDTLCDRTGTILIMKPINGEILAMCSYPVYNPNIYVLDNPENAMLRRFVELDVGGTPLYNRNIQTLYPAASLFKLVTSTAIVNENLVPLNKQFYCAGSFRLNHQYFGCWNRGGHGNLNLEEAVLHSCDVYFYNVAANNTIDVEKIYQYATMYGFGQETGVDLPYEKRGLIPNLQWKKEQKQTWHTGDTLNTIIGQGDVKITPLQIATMMSTICNKGVAYRPHFMKELRSSENGDLIRQYHIEKIVDMRDKVPESVFYTVEHQLRAVVERGTARWSFYGNQHKYVGKTGTAEYGFGAKKNTHSLFAGYGPLDYPAEDRIVVMILIENDNNDRLKYAANLANLVFYSYTDHKTYLESAKRFHYEIRSSYNVAPETN